MKVISQLFFITLLGAAAGNPAHAAPAQAGGTDGDTAFLQYMDNAPMQVMEPLDAQQMMETEGELWPLVGGIGAIVAVDLALQSYFWGVYVPTVANPPLRCSSCRVQVAK